MIHISKTTTGAPPYLVHILPTMLDLFVAALLALTIPASETVFTCRVCGREITVTLAGDRLVYSHRVPGKPEIKLLGGPGGGVICHRQLYSGGMHERPIFGRRQQDDENPTPDGA